jgi:hypothetical protein
MFRRTLIKMAFALVVAMVAAPELRAQEIVLEGPLVGQPAVRKLFLLRKGRLSVMPMAGLTMLDTYRRNVLIGGKIEYSILDWFAIGVWGTYAFNGGSCNSSACTWLDTKLTKEINDKSRDNIMNLPDATMVGKQIGTVNGLLTFQLSFIPLRGKLGLFKALFLNADFYFFIGGGIGFVTDRAYAEDEYSIDAVKAKSDPVNGPGYIANLPCLDQHPRDGKADDYGRCMQMKSRVVAVVPTFGAGFDLFINEWLAINIEYRALPMKLNVSGTDEYGLNANGTPGDPGYYNRSAGFPDHKIDDKDRVFTLIHTVNFGLAFYFTFGKSKGIMKSRLTD